MAADLVLVVDPGKTIHRMVDAALAREGVEVVSAGTAQAAAALLNQRHPNLVLLETAMPGLAETGVLTLLSALTRAEGGATLVLISADLPTAEATAAKNGIVYSGVLEKPFAAKALKVLVAKLAKEAAVARPAAPLPQATPPPLPPRGTLPAQAPGPGALPANMPPPPPPGGIRPRMTPSAATMLESVARAHTPSIPPVIPPAPVATSAEPKPTPIVAPPIPPVEPPVAVVAAAPVALPIPEPEPEFAPAEPDYEFDCPAALVSGREALVYLNNTKDTGLLTILSQDEAVHVYFNEGQVCFLSTDNPTLYLGEMVSPWKKTSADSLAAYEEQGQTGKPYVITLNQQEVRLRSTQLTTMIRRAGEEALVRALFTRQTRLRFRRLAQLPAFTTEFAQGYSLLQLLLLSYRAVRGWETIEKEIAHSGVVVNYTRYFERYADQLDLSDTEAKVIASVDGHRTIAEIAQESGCSTLEVGAVLYGFIRLGLIAVTMIPDSNAIVSPM